jgi:hypothetical protein
MSYSNSSSASDRYQFHFDVPTSRPDDPACPSLPISDRAIDVALRSVPLPQGLMTRLGRLVYTMSDDRTDQLDYLGC